MNKADCGCPEDEEFIYHTKDCPLVKRAKHPGTLLEHPDDCLCATCMMLPQPGIGLPLQEQETK